MEVLILILLGANLGLLIAIAAAVRVLGERQLRLMEGQITMMEIMAETGKFFAAIQGVHIMARRDIDEETLQ